MNQAEFQAYLKEYTAVEQYKIGNPTILYKYDEFADDAHRHYERGIGYIGYESVITDAANVQDYLNEGYSRTVLEARQKHLDSLKPSEEAKSKKG